MKFSTVNLSKHLLILLALFAASLCPAALAIRDLRCEYLVNPIGLDETSPRLSWILSSEQRGEKQTAYQILVASSAGQLNDGIGDLWDSGRVKSDATAQVVYAGRQLTSGQGCFWKVRTWNRAGEVGAWSSPAQWQMGLLQPRDWQAQWISPENPVKATNASLIIRRANYRCLSQALGADVTTALLERLKNNHLILMANHKTFGEEWSNPEPKRLHVDYEYDGKSYTKEIDENQVLLLPDQSWPLPYLRKSFQLKAPVQRAVLYATALGLYEARINGKRVGDQVLAPDWTDYRKRVRYQAYDVTTLLKPGDNALGVLLADGWFSGHIGLRAFQFFGKRPAFLAQLQVTYTDGRTELIVSDGSWKTRGSPVLAADFMMGEDYDARREIKGWDQPECDERRWRPVVIRDEPFRQLTAQVSEPVRQRRELTAKSRTEPKPGCWVYDFGQNMVGVVRLRLVSPAGTEVTLRHAEMLNSDGTLYTKNLRDAPSIDHYFCRGGGPETWQARFTIHGFRYVEISGVTNPPETSAVTGIVIGSDTPQTGEFSCSDPRLNQLQLNIQWSQRGNFISIPTDCPQRDERLGWMGDAEVFISTAAYNAAVGAFFTKWLTDVDDGQAADGAFSNVSPDTLGSGGTPGWGDAGVICPWTLYQVYGDRRILEQQLPAMIRWVEYSRAHSTNLIRDRARGGDYGDWLAMGPETPKDLIGTAFFAYSTHLLAESCRVLGHPAEADKYKQLFAAIRTAFNQRYVAADGRIQGNTQCAYALALKFDLLPEALRNQAGRYLAEDIQARGDHLTTGLIGVNCLLPMLTATGQADTAYRLLLQETFPSWLFSVKQGATTIWERWDGWTPEKGYQDPGMNSFNQYSLGSCGEYLFSGIGGIEPASPGYQTIRIQPVIRDGLTWAKTRYDSIRGPIATAWKREGRRLVLEVLVPANTTATVSVPARDVADITEGGQPVKQAPGVTFLRLASGNAVFAVESGSYRFESANRGVFQN